MFHVPELQRVTTGVMASNVTYGNNGAFLIPSTVDGWILLVLASDGREPQSTEEWADWEHVSVSVSNRKRSRIPCWDEMCQVKDLFWDAEDVVMQLHPRRSQYVNQHPNVLHLWRSKSRPIPEPPAILVGLTVSDAATAHLNARHATRY